MMNPEQVTVTAEQVAAFAERFELTEQEAKEILNSNEQLRNFDARQLERAKQMQEMLMMLPEADVRGALRQGNVPEEVINDFLKNRPAPPKMSRWQKFKLLTKVFNVGALRSSAFWRGFKGGFINSLEEKAVKSGLPFDLYVKLTLLFYGLVASLIFAVVMLLR